MVNRCLCRVISVDVHPHKASIPGVGQQTDVFHLGRAEHADMRTGLKFSHKALAAQHNNMCMACRWTILTFAFTIYSRVHAPARLCRTICMSVATSSMLASSLPATSGPRDCSRA